MRLHHPGWEPRAMEALREHQAAWVELWLVHGARAGQRVPGTTKNGARMRAVRDSLVPLLSPEVYCVTSDGSIRRVDYRQL